MSAVLKPPKRKRCKVCLEHFSPWRTTQKVCGPSCAVVQAKRDEQKRAKREKREGRERLKTLKTVCSEVQHDVNRYVRARDAHLGCISCESGRVDDAGHFFPIGSKWQCSRLRFDIRLIHGQCRKCNSYTGGGNLHGYIEGVKSRYGEEYLALMYEIKRMAEHGQLPPLTKDEARQIGADHRRLCNELKKARAA